jgi:hypothetical protein
MSIYKGHVSLVNEYLEGYTNLTSKEIKAKIQ